MTTLRIRREAAGLVQMNVWIRQEDTEAFRAAVKPFRQRAKELEGRGRPVRQPDPPAPPTACTLWFRRELPPDAVRAGMVRAGWRYDRVADEWTMAWAYGAEEDEMWFLEELRERYEAG